MENDMSKLKAKRGNIKAQLTRFQKFMADFTDDSLVQLSDRLTKCEDLWDAFDQVQCAIEEIDTSEIQQSERGSFEDSYFKVISEAKKIHKDKLSGDTNTRPTQSGSSSTSHANKNVKLPIMEIPPYEGSYKLWLQFYDVFHSLVHSNDSLSDTQKFYYLKNALKGDAAEVIQSLEVTAENYKVAWDLLRETYENKKLITLSQIDLLYDFPTMVKESHTSLRKLINVIKKGLRVLKILDQPVETWDTLLIYILERKLDPKTQMKWKEAGSLDTLATMDDFLKFLQHRCQLLESTNDGFHKGGGKVSTNDGFNKVYSGRGTTTKSFAIANQTCPLCKDSHLLFYCKQFIGMPVHARRAEVKRVNVCWNCLRQDHRVQDCTSRGCKNCGKKHNSLLHGDFQHTTNSHNLSDTQQASTSKVGNNTTNTRERAVVTEQSSISNETTTLTTYGNANAEILLSTALLFILDKYGNAHECRALLDSGSQSNFITKTLCEKLQLNTRKIDLAVAGISEIATSVSHIANATISSKFNSFSIIAPFLVINKITDNLPVVKVSRKRLKVPEHLTLADTTYNKSGKIDLLLGATIFWDLLCGEQVKLGKNLPIMQKTKLGWVISGIVPGPNSESSPVHATQCNLITSGSIQDQLEKFWCIEECQQSSKLSKEEVECEEHFQLNTRRNEDGRFIVSLPLRGELSDFGNSYDMALKRFHLLERKLAKNKELRDLYIDFMKEYEDLGHMSRIDEDTEVQNDRVIYYLPHHGVLKDISTTTKLRVVFDASSVTDKGISLNNKLKVGPKIQDDLFAILIRFRKHNFILVADIAKMYRQVLVTDEHRDLQRILWRASTDEPVHHYRLATVTYGTASASFLAVRCLQQLGMENKAMFPVASEVIMKDFYVDDLLTGADTIEGAKQLRQDLTTILDTGGFLLRKWMSNNINILDNTSGNIQEIEHFISDDKTIKTLGLVWNSEADLLQYSINLNEKQEKVTKRTILSVIAQIYDPLGLLGPVIITAKIVLQKLWQLKLNWDEAVPLELYTYWEQFRSQLQHLNKVRIPRHVMCQTPREIQLHGFSDASESGYGACIYIRSRDATSNKLIQLLCAKSRVAPLKVISLPRLELCGALLLAKLTREVVLSINLDIDRIVYWCDSTIVLSWIAGEPNQWKTIVANRTSEIQRLTDKHQWRHVDSKDNPADIISRGMKPEQLALSSLWFNGPTWLGEDEELWPKLGHARTVNVPEEKNIIYTFISSESSFKIFDKFSSLTRLQRVIAYCLRFKVNASMGCTQRLNGGLTVEELNNSLTALIRLAQSQSFAAERQSLLRAKAVSNTSRLSPLNPFIDDSGLIRVGGRLGKAEVPYEQRHQVILPSGHILTNLIILREHHKNLHAGPQALLATIRLRYWILSGRSTVRRVLHKCITCFRARPVSYRHIMGELPKARVVPARPFSNSGVDYAGPFDTKISNLRGRKTIIKCYLCIFVCFSTKAVHLELVSDLRTESFLNCLKRFVARRGISSNIYSDNGTNFVGAANDLKTFFEFIRNPENQTKFSEYLSLHSIAWHFIPPRSPHFGGLWEAAVKTAKYHIKRVVGNTLLTFEELYTVITQVEACMNSRPLTPLSEDPNDLNALTPGHFLIGTSLTAIPQNDLRDHNPNRLSRYHHLTQMIQHFWTRWSREYLSQLQERSKWRSTSDSIQPGALVVIKDENLPPLMWQLARVIQLHPGDDNVSRVASVKTSKGVFKRALSKLCVLPINIS